MSAVFTGNGLGLFNTSLSQLGNSLGGNAGIGQGRDQQYVNLATGNLVWQGSDEYLVFRGLAVGLNRTYNSLGQLANVGADGWTTGFERRVALLSGTFNTAGSVMRRYTGDGAFQDFVYTGPNEYTSIEGAGAHDTLSWTGADWTYVEGSTRRQEQYADHADAVAQGRLTYLRDPRSDGTTPVTWQVIYDSQQRIAEIRADDGGTTGDALVFGYDGQGRLASVSTREQGVVRQQVAYAYDAQGRLASVLTDLTPENTGDNTWDATTASNNDGHLFRTDYTYVGTGLQLASVRQSDGTLISYTYHADGRLQTVTRGDDNANDADGVGETTTYTYATGSTTVSDSLGRSWTYTFDGAGQLTSVTSPAVDGLSDVTTYQYDADGNLVMAVTTRGADVLAGAGYAYDGNGNVVWEWDAAGNAVSNTWSASNQLLSQTRYTGVDPDLDGATLPTGGMTTHYLYDSQDRLRFVVDALGQVTESSYATAGNGIGQAQSVRQYLGAGYAGAYTLADLQTWASGQRGNSLLTEMAYDAWGRLSQSIRYAAVDASGNGVVDDATTMERFIHDAQGNLRQQITLRGSARGAGAPAQTGSEQVDFLYDGMGRLLGTVARQVGVTDSDQTTLQTSYAYLDSGHQIAVTDDAGRVVVQTYDPAGRLVSVSEQGAIDGVPQSRATINYYDSAGQLRASEDATGARSYFFYDAKGRLEATVEGTGAVSRNEYDGADRLTVTRDYANRLTTTGWLVSGQVVPGDFDSLSIVDDALLDRVVTLSYDIAGRLITRVEGRTGETDQLVTSYFYDGSHRLVQVSTSGTVDPTQRTVRYLYDEADRLIGELDTAGYLIESRYDRAGRLTSVTHYATQTEFDYWADGTVDQLRPAADESNDQTTRYFYDGRGQRIGMLDAEGYLTEWTYDEAGHTRAERRYADAVTWIASDTVDSMRLRAGGHHEQRTAYNALGQLTTATDFEGAVTRYHYDDAGRLVRTEIAQGTSEVREGHLRYNVFGELIGELSGESALHLLPGMTEAQLDAVYAQYGVRHQYNALGQRIESIDSAGNKTWYFYDAAGRQTTVVRGQADQEAGVANALGEVTQTQYNAFGEVSAQISYTDAVVIAVPGDRDSVLAAISVLTYLPEGVDSLRQYAYTWRGQLASVTDATGAINEYGYDAFGQMIRQVVAAGSTAESVTEYGYDRRGNLIAVTEGLGSDVQRERTQYYDAFGRVVEARDYRNARQTFSYDRLGRQITQMSSVRGRDQLTSTTYDAYDRVLTVTDAHGETTTYSYDDSLRTVTVTSPEGVTLVTQHNLHGETIRATDADGYTEYAYNASGQLTGTTRRATDGTLVQSQAQEFDAARGLLLATVDGQGRRVEFRYDAAGRMLERTVDPQGIAATTVYRYDAQGRMVSVTDATGRVTEQYYDREGRLTDFIQDPEGFNVATFYAYDAAGRQVAVYQGDGPGGVRHTVYEYDALGRRVREIIDPDVEYGLQLTTSYEYDANGNVTRRTDANGSVTTFAYDEANQLTHEVNPLGTVTRYWYDMLGRRTAYAVFDPPVDPTQLPTDWTYHDLDALVADADMVAGDFRAYDADSNLRFVATLGGSVTEYAYDANGRLASTRAFAAMFVPQDGLAWSLREGGLDISLIDTSFLIDDAHDQRQYLVYDAAGRVRYTVNALGHVTGTTYDLSGAITGTQGYAAPMALTPTLLSALQSGQATMDDVEAALTAGTNDHQAWLVADAAGRPSFQIDAAGAVVEQIYDGAGRLVQTRRYADALALTPTLRQQLADGTLSSIALAALMTPDDAQDTLVSHIYDTAGRRIATLEGEGSLRVWRYDGLNQLIGEIAYDQTLALASLHVDVRAGLVSSENFEEYFEEDLETQNPRATFYQYDAAGRRTFALSLADVASDGQHGPEVARGGVGAVQWVYDGVGRVIAQYAYPGVSEVFDWTAGFSENAIGSLIGRISMEADYVGAPSDSRATRYVYDAAGRLGFVIAPDSSVTATTYTALGQVAGTAQYGQLDLEWDWDLQPQISFDDLQQIIDLGSYTARTGYNEYDAAGNLVAQYDALDNVAYYSYDGLGQLLSYENRLGYVWEYAYDQAGRRIEESSPPVSVSTADASGLVTTVTRPVVTRTGYDNFGNVVSRTEDAESARPRVTQYAYDSRGNQILTTFPDAGMLDASGNLVASGNTAPTIEITYDALGRAVMQKDVRGFYSYKVYDNLDRVIYEVDQEGYVTQYDYNAYGEQIMLQRLATPVELTAHQPVSRGDLEALLVRDNLNDRRILTFYDRAGRKARVDELVYDYVYQQGMQWAYGATTQYQYNVYGDLVVEKRLGNNGSRRSETYSPIGYDDIHGELEDIDRWLLTFHYYDDAGRRIGTVDAEKYKTDYTYDAMGQLIEVAEIGSRVGEVEGQYNNFVPSVYEEPEIESYWGDHITQYQYDALGRRINEWSRRGGHPEANRHLEIQTEYDDEGRATSVSVNGNETRTAYDAMGRIVSVTEDARSVLREDAYALLLDGSTTLSDEDLLRVVSPYTEMAYDAFGNRVQLRRYANGLAEGATSPVASAQDSVQTSRYDWQGRNVWELDATGGLVTKQYDAADNLLNSRYSLTANNGRSAEVISEATYDRVGRQITSKVHRVMYQNDQATGEEVTDTTSQVRYNAFGEVIAKDDRLDPQLATALFAVQFLYDQNGRLIRSNADGMERHYTYNAAGHQTSERHQVLVVDEYGSNYQWLETTMYNDHLGRVVEQDVPALQGSSTPPHIVKRTYDRWGNVLEIEDQRGNITRYQYDQGNVLLREVRPTVTVINSWGAEEQASPEINYFTDGLGNIEGWQDVNDNWHSNNYDGYGRLLSSVDANGATTVYRYDAFGQLRLTENAIGHLTYTDFDASGRVVEQGDFLTTSSGTTRVQHQQEAYVLNEQGNRLQVTDALGNTSSYDYDSRGLMTRSRTAAGVVTEYAYDSQGNKIRESNALSENALISETQPVYRGGVVNQQYVVAGQNYSYTVPTDAFSIPNGETLTITARIEKAVTTNGVYRYETATDITWNATTGVLSGPALALGNYRIVLTAQATSGQIATAYVMLGSLSQTDYDTSVAAHPVANLGLYHQKAEAGDAFSYQIPANAFVDPQGQTLTYTAKVSTWQRVRDPLTRIVDLEEVYVDLPSSPTVGQWLAFNAGTRTLYGTPYESGRYTLKITATDSDGNSTEQFLTVEFRGGNPTPVINAGFESGSTGWVLAPNTGATLDVMAGGYSSANLLRFVGTGEAQDGYVVMQTGGAVVPGQSVNARAMVQLANGTFGTSYSMVLVWYDAAGNEIGRTQQAEQRRGDVGYDWRSTGISANAPSGAASVKVGFYLNASASSTPSLIYIDNVSWNLRDLSPGDTRTQIIDDEGEVVFLDEQTWNYDYFGRLIDHNDLSGADYDYEYDPITGQLIRQSSSWTEEQAHIVTPVQELPGWINGEDGWSYSELELQAGNSSDPSRQLFYYGNGQLREVREGVNWTRFDYDESGNRILEETYTINPQGQVVHLRTQATYDSHNRITLVTQDNMAQAGTRLLEVRYAYDAAGNRRRVMVNGNYNGGGGGSSTLPTNLDFENGDTEWNKGTGWTINQENDSDAYSGSWSAMYTGLGNASLNSGHLIAVEAGDVFTASVMIQSRNNSAAELLMLWEDVDGNVIKIDKGPLVKSGNHWGMSSKAATAPAGAVGLRIGVSAQNDSGEGPVFVDRFEITKNSGSGGPPPTTGWQTYWYAYDAENRVTVVNGDMVGGEVVLGDAEFSYALSYDGAGRATQRRFLQNGVVMEELTQYDERGQALTTFQARTLGSTAPMQLQDTYAYDAMGRQLEHRQYFAAGTTQNGVDVSGWLKHAEVSTYDADGRILTQNIHGRPLSWTPNTGVDQVSNLGVLSLVAAVNYELYGYDEAGRLRGYSYSYLQHEFGSGAQASDPSNYTHRYTYQYEGRESYLEKQVIGTSTNPYFRTSNSVSTYDAWGRRVAIRENTPKTYGAGATVDDRVRYFAYDSDGNILQRREGSITSSGSFAQSAEQKARDQIYAYVGGQHIGSGQRSGKVDVISRMTAYDSSESGTLGVMVQTGDTMRSLAQRVYGNSNLWYVLAEANALQSDSDLIAGSTLKVPEVKVTANDANTFKPFNPGEAIGNTAPGLPYIEPPPQQAGCNMLQAIIIIVVAVVVTYVTAGAASSAMYGLTVAELGIGQGIAVGAIAGAAGAAASGAVGSAMGATSFSWRNVAAGAISGAITGGFAAAANQGALGGTLQNASWARGAASAVVGNLANYGANRIVGNQASFSWRSVASSAVSGGVSGAATSALGTTMNIDLGSRAGQAQADIMGQIIGGIVGAHTRRALTGEEIDYQMIAVDAFSNVLGNSLSGQHADYAAMYRDEQRGNWTASLSEASNDIGSLAAREYEPRTTDIPTMLVRATPTALGGWDFLAWDRHNKYWVNSMYAVMNRHDGHVDPIIWSMPPKTKPSDPADLLRNLIGAEQPSYLDNLISRPRFSPPDMSNMAKKDPTLIDRQLSSAREAVENASVLDKLFNTDEYNRLTFALTAAELRKQQFDAAPLYTRKDLVEGRRAQLDAYVLGIISLEAKDAVALRDQVHQDATFYSNASYVIGQPTNAEQAYIAYERLKLSNDLKRSFLGPIASAPANYTEIFGGDEYQIAGALDAGALMTDAGLALHLPHSPTAQGVSGTASSLRPISARLEYLGTTPDKFSKTGAVVVERMRAEGLIVGEGPLLRGNPNDLKLVTPDGTLVRIDHTIDMAHRTNAVTWWNENGRFFGPKSPEVRRFMLDPNNYMLQLRSTNRSEGARLGETYKPPLPPIEPGSHNPRR